MLIIETVPQWAVGIISSLVAMVFLAFFMGWMFGSAWFKMRVVKKIMDLQELRCDSEKVLKWSTETIAWLYEQ